MALIGWYERLACAIAFIRQRNEETQSFICDVTSMNLSWPAVFIKKTQKPTCSMLFIEVFNSLNSGTLSSYFKIVFQWDPSPNNKSD